MARPQRWLGGDTGHSRHYYETGTPRHSKMGKGVRSERGRTTPCRPFYPIPFLIYPSLPPSCSIL